MSQQASQPARPKLDIRSLATPKPPRRFRTQAVTPQSALTPNPAASPCPPLTPHYAFTPNPATTPQPHLDATPSLYSQSSLPSPPFTPIDPPVPPPPSLHTQPLHSTPLLHPTHSAFHDDAKAFTRNKLHGQENFGQEKRNFCDSETSLPSPAYMPLSKPLVLSIPCLKAGSSSPVSGDGESSPDEEDMDQGDHSLDRSDSLPSPAYVPISKCVSMAMPSVPPAEAVPPTPWQEETGVKEESKVESVFELSLDSLLSDYPEGGVDGLIVEPGEQNGLPGGGQEDLRGAVCLGDDGGELHHPSTFQQNAWMTRFSTPTTNPRLTGPGQVETGRMTHHLPDQQCGDRERSAYTTRYSRGKGGWTTSSEEKEAVTRHRMDWTAVPVQPAVTACSPSSQLSRDTSSSSGLAKPGWSSALQMDRADSTSLYNRGAAFSTPGPVATAWSSSSRDLDRAAYSNTEPPLTAWSSSSRDLDRAARTNTGQLHVSGWSSSRELDRAAYSNTGQPPGTAWSSSRELDNRAAYSTTEPATTAWSSSRDLETAAYSSSQLAAKLPGTSDEWDRRGDMLPHSQDSGQHRQVLRLTPSTTPTHHPPPALNTLSQKVSHLGKARSLFSPSPSPRSNSAKSNQLEKSVDREKGEEMGQEEEKVLSICYAGGNLGAALFNTYTGKLELLRDIPDLSPGYEMLTSLVYQVEPDIILVSARQDQTLLECLRCLCGNPDSESSAATLDGTDGDDRSGDCGGGRCVSLVMRPGMEFGLSSCLRRVKRMEVPGKPSTCEQEQLVKLSAFVDFSCNSLVRAAGALLKYLDKNYRTGLDMETPMVLFISSLVLEQILTMDQSAFTALQVFSVSAQLSGSKAGSWNRRREGLSILNILNRCGSVVGSRFMRRMLRCPSANLEVIILRQQAITFFTSSGNVEFVQALSSSIKQIKNFHRLMNKLVSNTMTVSDWQAMYRTLSGLVQLAQLGENCKVDVPILREVMHKVTDSVYSLRSVVEQVIDFQASLASGNLSVKPGVDQELDEKRRLHNALPDLLNVVAQEESKNLPPYMQVCTVCYLPQVGYLIAIPYKKELEDQGVDFRNIPGFEFVFESNGAMHYRNRRTLALDQTMGDVVLDITKVEMGILSRLTEAVLRNRNSMEEAVSLCGQLDCLLALAMVSKENNWTRPVMMDTGDLVIKEGRHPLQELSVTDFIPNSSWLGGEGGRVHLLTGPNSSGKSVYMKQVGLIVYLAHLGCWVPALEARIPIMDRILTRIQTVESISLGMSSFLCDINQLSTALSTSSPRSLLLVDEFGKGTAPSDGAALLAATVLELLSLDQASPLAILSSHFHMVPPLLGTHAALRYFQLETKATTTGLVYMFKLMVGVSGTSQARHVALKAGIQEDLVNRVDRVLEGLVTGQPAGLEESLLSLENIHQIVSCYLDVDLGKEEEVDIFIERLEDLVM